VKTKLFALAAAGAVAGAIATTPAVARDQIRIVGSSTVYPYTQAVAEEYAKKSGKAPVLESTGTGGGMKLFCSGIGEANPDITGASRAMKQSEWELCAKNGVTDVSEVLIGYDGLSVALSRKGQDFDLTKAQLYQALASKLPVDGKLVDNPNKTWSDIDEALPNVPILIYGPPPSSGTRDALNELVMEKGCEKVAFFEAKKKELKGTKVEVVSMGKKKMKDAWKVYRKETCRPMRQDGLFVEAGENDNLIVQRLEADPKALGIFGYSFLFENQDRLKAAKIAGVAPGGGTIKDGSYGISRPLFFYVKNAHRRVIDGMNDFIAEYVSEGSFGADGYLVDRGLVTLSDEDREKIRNVAVKGEGQTRYTN
jgi:phosphate transport system substrate-binding protein